MDKKEIKNLNPNAFIGERLKTLVEQMQDYQNGAYTMFDHFILEDNSEGLPVINTQAPLTMPVSIIRHLKNSHHAGAYELLYQINQLIKDYVLALQSKTKENGLVYVLDRQDVEGNYFVCVMHMGLNIRGIEVNSIRSLYEKKKLKEMIESTITAKFKLYTSDKTKNWLTSYRAQCSDDLLTNFLCDNHNMPSDIRQERDGKNSMKRLFVDMDGTLAEFKTIEKFETLYEEGYFRDLRPQQNVIDAIKEIITDKTEYEVYVISAVLEDSKYALKEKKAWLKEYLPELHEKNQIFTACGKDKREWVSDLKDNDFLLDDYTKNLLSWSQQIEGKKGSGIKLLNGKNDTHKTWEGARVSKYSEGSVLVKNLINIMEGKKIEQILKGEHRMDEKVFSELLVDLAKKEEGVFKAHVTNINKYNEGDLVGEWLTFPTTTENVNRLFEYIGLTGENKGYFVSDYNVSNQNYLDEILGEYVDINDLNMIATLINKNEVNQEAVEAYVNETPDIDIVELGNVLLQANEIPFIEYSLSKEQSENLSKEQKYGYTWLEGTGETSYLERTGLLEYIDVEKIGRESELSGKITLYNSGYFDRTVEMDLTKYDRFKLREMAGIEQDVVKSNNLSEEKEISPKI